MGQAVKEFRKGTQEVEEGLNKLANEPAAESKPAAPAASAQTQTTTQETK